MSEAMMGVIQSRGKTVAYLVAPTISTDAISSDLVLIVRHSRAKKPRVIIHFGDGTTLVRRIRWDGPNPGPTGATAKGEYEFL